jgi:hypothetical protein
MKNNTTSTIRQPEAWQTNSNNVDRPFVQFWSMGVMVTAQMKLAEARLLVETGNAFVICTSAIGLLTNGGMDS